MDWIVINSLWPSDAIWWQGSGTTLAQVMACCLTAPSHYLSPCWLVISKVRWHSLWENLKIPALKTRFEFVFLKWQPDLPVAKELIGVLEAVNMNVFKAFGVTTFMFLWSNAVSRDGRFEWNFRYVIFKLILVIDDWCIFCEIALIRMSPDFTDD